MSISVSKRREQPSRGAVVDETWLLLGTFYGVIVAAAVPLAAAELTPLYPLAAAFVCAAHALLVGAGGRPLLSDAACQMLSIAALLFGAVQTVFFNVHISYSLGHFLLIVQLILLCGPHRARELRLILVVALFELMIAGMWALELIYLPAFILSALAIIANLVAMEMHSTARSPGRSFAPQRAARAVSVRDFLAAVWVPALVVVALTAALFPVLPRLQAFRTAPSGSGQYVTGFSENVSLREVGILRQSDRIALRAQFFREDLPGKPAARPDRLLMRGASLPLYRQGQWFGYSEAIRMATLLPSLPNLIGNSYFASQQIYELRNVDVRTRLILQRVELEDRPGRNLFALYRPLSQKAGAPYELARGKPSDDLVNPARYLTDRTYEVVSLVPTFTPRQLREAGTPRPAPPWLAFWHVPEDLRSVLEATATEIEELYHPATDYDRVRATEQYLLSTQRFTYTLELPDYGQKEPIEAFLTDTRRGSCEQFSSAMALILRVWGIPTRLVVGYKEGTYDPAFNGYVFRDRDAHAWVEVFFNDLGWVEFDPTPGSDQPLAEPAAGGLSLSALLRRLRRAASGLFHYADTRWGIYVIGYNREQQRAIFSKVSATARQLAQDATSVLRALWPGMPDLGFVQVALLVAVLTFAGICLFLGAARLDSALRRRRSRPRARRTLRFYEQMLAIMRRKGLRRSPHQTPREFADAVAAYLAQADDGAERAAHLLTDLYYRARFGGYELNADEQSQVREALCRLKNTPRPRRQPGRSAAPA